MGGAGFTKLFRLAHVGSGVVSNGMRIVRGGAGVEVAYEHHESMREILRQFYFTPACYNMGQAVVGVIPWCP